MGFESGGRIVVSSVVAVALVGVASASAAMSSFRSAAPRVTLSVSVVGTGNGWVTGSTGSAGDGFISCGTICSAPFTPNVMATLFAQAAEGSRFAGWSATPPYSCGRPGGGGFPPGQSGCQVFLSDTPGNAFVQVTFNRVPPPCVTPNVKGMMLAKAKYAIKGVNCRVGKISRAFSKTEKKGRVISQSPPAYWRREHGAKINLVVSQGRR